MDDLINAAFRKFLDEHGVITDCFGDLPLWENTAKCRDFYKGGGDCENNLVWAIRYLGGTSRSLSTCKDEVRGSFQIEVYPPTSKGMESAYQAIACLKCKYEKCGKIKVIQDEGLDTERSLTLHLMGRNSQGIVTRSLTQNTIIGRPFIPVDVPFLAIHCRC